MRLDEGLYEPILMRRGMLRYCKGLIALTGHYKLVSGPYHSTLSLNEDQMPYDLQPGDYVHWKRHHLKDSLQPRWKVPYQVLLSSSCTAKSKVIDSWIHISHLKRHRSGLQRGLLTSNSP